MKRIALLMMSVFLIGALHAQKDTELRPEFKIKGLAISVSKGDIVSKDDISAKTWILEGKVVDGINTVSFRAFNKKTGEQTDSSFYSNVKVTLKYNKKGNECYIVHDLDSMYWRALKIKDDVYAIKMKPEPIQKKISASNGAEGKWDKVTVEADELKGIEGGTTYIYTAPKMGSFVIWDFDKFQYRLVSDEAQFDIESGWGKYTGHYSGIKVNVGIYNDDNVLIDKFEMWLDKEDNRANRFVRTRDAGGMSNPVGQKGKVRKIFNALKSGSGYVRIVAARYNTTDFDIRIKPYNIE